MKDNSQALSMHNPLTMRPTVPLQWIVENVEVCIPFVIKLRAPGGA